MYLLADTLGLTVTSKTTKQAVGQHFATLGTKIGEASSELEKVAVKAAEDTEKDASSKNLIRVAVEAAKKILDALKTNLESLKDIGGGGEKVGEVGSSSNQQGVTVNEDALKKVYDALKGMVDIATKEGVKTPEKSTLAISDANLGGTSPQNGAKVLTAGAAAGGTAGLEASTIVSAVSGEEILAAIVGSTAGDAVTGVGSSAVATTSALAFAKGTSNTGYLAQASALAGAVSGGIALRSLVKEGKLASNTGNDKKGAEVAGRSATNKLLRAVEDIIKMTVKNVLDKAKGEIDKARDLKATVQ